MLEAREKADEALKAKIRQENMESAKSEAKEVAKVEKQSAETSEETEKSEAKEVSKIEKQSAESSEEEKPPRKMKKPKNSGKPNIEDAK